ncbi:MAG: hypothetical protein RLZZ450_462 [Pseudomonadota bacterium]
MLVRRSNGTKFGAVESWSDVAYYGTFGTYFADVTGDGKDDAIVINTGAPTIVRRANASGTGFGPNEQWTNIPYYGNLNDSSKGTYFADVNGDGKADAIAINTGAQTVVRLSTGSKFSDNGPAWTDIPYYGTFDNYFADVTGDGKADAIVINPGDPVIVRRSTGKAFATTNEVWTDIPYYGNLANHEIGTYFVDVSGDGKADAIAVNTGAQTVVRVSNGSKFDDDGLPWTDIPYYGNLGTYFADVDGSQGADAIALNVGAPAVGRLSTGQDFAGGTRNLVDSGPYAGTHSTYIADVTGDGKADLILLNLLK